MAVTAFFFWGGQWDDKKVSFNGEDVFVPYRFASRGINFEFLSKIVNKGTRKEK